jgi:hypothetical protein
LARYLQTSLKAIVFLSENINVSVLLKLKKPHLFDNNKNVIAVFGTWGLRGRDHVVVGFTAT